MRVLRGLGPARRPGRNAATLACTALAASAIGVSRVSAKVAQPKKRLKLRNEGGRSTGTSSRGQLTSLFNELDVDGNNELSQTELQSGLKKLGLPSGDDYVSDIFHQYDSDDSGSISKSEFLSYVKSKEKAMYSAFKSIDVDRNGCVTPDEIYKVLSKLGIKGSKSDADKMLRLLDSNKDGVIEFKEFKAFASMLPASQLRGNSVYCWAGCSVDRVVSNPRDPWKQLCIGAIAGAASRFVTAPLERIRIMLMAGQGNTTALSAMSSVLKQEGITGLWRGTTPKMLKVMPGSAINYTVFARVKGFFMRRNEDGDVKPWQTLAAGASAGFVSTVFVYPLNCIAGQMSVPGGLQGNMFSAVAQIYKNFGLAGFYKGLNGELVGDVWGMMLGFGMFDFINQGFTKVVGRKPRTYEKGFVGGISGCISLTTQMPLMLATTRMQMQGLPGYPILYKNLWDCIQKIAKAEGVWPALWKGLGPTYAKVFPAIFISYFVNEALTKQQGIGGLNVYENFGLKKKAKAN